MTLYKDKGWLENQYITLRKSSITISKECNCSKKTILDWLKKFNIERRSLSESHIGQIAWNKGKKGLVNFSEETKEKMRHSAHRGKNHHKWKGDKVNVDGLHQWISRYKQKLDKCEICGSLQDKNGKTGLELSNITGNYERNINDFQWAHHSCHVNYDIENGLWGNSHIDYKKRRCLMSP